MKKKKKSSKLLDAAWSATEFGIGGMLNKYKKRGRTATQEAFVGIAKSKLKRRK